MSIGLLGRDVLDLFKAKENGVAEDSILALGFFFFKMTATKMVGTSHWHYGVLTVPNLLLF